MIDTEEIEAEPIEGTDYADPDLPDEDSRAWWSRTSNAGDEDEDRAADERAALVGWYDRHEVGLAW